MNIVKNNSGYHVIFNMNSDKDAEDTSKLIGDYTNIKISKSQGNMELFKSNISKSKEAKKLVTAQDLKNQDSSDILILVKGFYKMPIKAKVPYWFKMAQWKGADKLEVEAKDDQGEAAVKQDAYTPKKGSEKEAKGEVNTAQNGSSEIKPADDKRQQRDELLKALKIKVDRE